MIRYFTSCSMVDFLYQLRQCKELQNRVNWVQLSLLDVLPMYGKYFCAHFDNLVVTAVFLYSVISLKEGSQTMACPPPTSKSTFSFLSTSFFVKAIICWSLNELAS